MGKGLAINAPHTPNWPQAAFPRPDATFTPSPLAYSTKSELVYRHLREMIVNGQIHSGTHLYLDEIARTLGVSTNPVREALRRLESEGLIINRPHAGATVAAIDVEKIETHFLIRGLLEGLAVRLAAGRVTDTILEHIDAFDRQLAGLEEASDYRAWNEVNIAFHRFVFDCSGSPDLVAMIDLQRDRSPRYRHFPDVLFQRVHEGHEERHALIEALRARDADAAEKLQRATAARTGAVFCSVMGRSSARPEVHPEDAPALVGGGC